MPRNRRYHYTVKVLTPLHIGSGETIPDFAYHVTDPDTDPCHWTLLDLETAAADLLRTDSKADLEPKKVAELAKADLDTYGKYTLEVLSEIARTLKPENIWQQKSENLRQQKSKDISEQIKLHGKPYLPGSSLKGAIRTALIGEILSQQEKKAAFEKALKDSLKERNIKKPYLTDKAEETVWGSDPHHDPLRGLRIGDSAEVSPQEHMTISDVRVMGFDIVTVSPKLELELFWEKLGRTSRHLQTPDDATQSFLETFRPGTILEGELTFNTFLLEEPWVKERLGFQGKADLLLPERLKGVCQEKYQTLFQQELALYDTLNATSNGQLKQVVANLTDIQKKEAPGAKEFLLQLSWGTGWRAKTVGERIERKLLGQIDEERRFRQPGKDYALADFYPFPYEKGDFLSPKTRRIVMEGDTPVWPLGWVKVSLHQD